MANEIDIPESFRFWLIKENAVALAIIADQEHIPPSLQGPEAWEFYRAKITYATIKNDFYDMLMNIWLATWGKAVEKTARFFSYAPVTTYTEDMNYSAEDWLSPDMVWENKEFTCILKPSQSNADRTLATSVFYDDRRKTISLLFYVFSGNVEASHSDAVIIHGDEWSAKCEEINNDDGYPHRATKHSIPIDKSSLKIDMGNLQKAASTALDAMCDKQEYF